MLDFHNHTIPGVDDGAQDLDQSRSALRAFRDSGVDAVIATPHFNGSLTHDAAAMAERLEEIDAGWAALTAMAAAEFPELRLERGVELMLDTPDPDLSDGRLRLAGTRFVLLEFPMMTVPPQVAHALAGLVAKGWTPIVAHPERYLGIEHRVEQVEEWRRAGAHLQVNCGSLVGRYGDPARKVAWTILERGWADYMASDYHARSRTLIRAAQGALAERGGAEQAQFLHGANPRRILEGQSPWPVQPLPRRRSGWGRVAAIFGR